MSETKYQRLITPYHKKKPKFYDHISLITAPFLGIQQTTNQLTNDFDLDSSIGNQEDAVGLWVGIGRNIRTPITDVYFSLDTDGLGFDLGSWKGPYDSLTGFTRLDDETYRTILRAKIQANHWDGTVETLSDIYQSIFPDGRTKIFAVDNFDMTMTIYIAGEQISSVMRAVIAQGYLDVKPAGVGVTNYIISTEAGALFGFDLDNEYSRGFDRASWGSPLRATNG